MRGRGWAENVALILCIGMGLFGVVTLSMALFEALR